MFKDMPGHEFARRSLALLSALGLLSSTGPVPAGGKHSRSADDVIKIPLILGSDRYDDIDDTRAL